MSAISLPYYTGLNNARLILESSIFIAEKNSVSHVIMTLKFALLM